MSASIKAGLNNDMHLMTDGVTRAYVDGNGKVGIGTSSPTRQLDVSKAGTAYIRASDTANSVNMDMLAASSGGWIGTQTNHSLMFQTNNTERLRIDSDGLKFHGDTAAANALDDYEEGTFALNNAGDGTGVVASTGKYVKIGRQVTVHAIANVTTNFTSQAMDGLPFAPSHVTTFSSIHGAAVCIGANVFAVNCNSGLTRVEFRNTSHAATAPTTGPIRFTLVYQTT